MNAQGNSLVLTDQTGIITMSPAKGVGIVLTSALVGSLTINGMADVTGAAIPWVISPGANGYQAPPGEAGNGGDVILDYSLSNVADVGKATAFWQPA